MSSRADDAAGTTPAAEDTDDRILNELLEAVGRGREPDLAGLRRRFPGHARRIDELFDAAVRYRELSDSNRARPKLAPGDRIGDFQIVGLLAKGGMGEVYRACQLSLGRRPVALKILPAVSRDEARRVRFEREGLILASLHHPKLAEVFGYGHERGLSFIAMRLIEGETLRDLSGRLTTAGVSRDRPEIRRRLVQWVADVAEALEVVHAKGLVHRDVKPSNIIVEGASAVQQAARAEGAAVLVDFGLVRAVDDDSLTHTGATPATPDFASPEQLLGAEVGPSSDVFSLGVTLHDLLTGRGPRDRPRASAGMQPVETIAAGVDPDLAAIVGKAVDPIARWRFPSGGELRADLVAWLDGRAVSARRRSYTERLRRAVAERPERILRGVALVALAAATVLALSELGRLRAAASAVHAAYRDGEPERMRESAEAIPRWLQRFLLRDRRVAELSRRLVEGAAQDPVVEWRARCAARIRGRPSSAPPDTSRPWATRPSHCSCDTSRRA